MTATVAIPVRRVAAVAAAASHAFAARGRLALESDLADVAPGVPASLGAAPAIVVTESQRIEIVLDAEDDPGLLRRWVEEMAEAGWSVVVLVPGPLLGPAHARLRGGRCKLQQWWLDASAVHFGGLEVP